MENKLPNVLPDIKQVIDDPSLVRGMRLVASDWCESDGAVVVRHYNPLTKNNEYVAYYKLVFVRDEANDLER